MANGVAPEDQITQQSSATTTAISGSADEYTEYYDATLELILTRPVHGYVLDKTSIAAYDQEIATLSNVPSGVSVTIGENTVISDGTPIEITIYEPGVYRLFIEDFPTQAFEEIINAS